jgi:hypothetical protein
MLCVKCCPGRRDNIDGFGKLALLSYAPDLHVAHAEIAQAIGVTLNAAYALLRHGAGERHRTVSIAANGSWHPLRRGKESGRYGQKIGRVIRGQPLVFLDGRSYRIVIGVPDKSVHAGVDLVDFGIFGRHPPDGTDDPCGAALFNRSEANPQQPARSAVNGHSA